MVRRFRWRAFGAALSLLHLLLTMSLPLDCEESTLILINTARGVEGHFAPPLERCGLRTAYGVIRTP